MSILPMWVCALTRKRASVSVCSWVCEHVRTFIHVCASVCVCVSEWERMRPKCIFGSCFGSFLLNEHIEREMRLMLLLFGPTLVSQSLLYSNILSSEYLTNWENGQIDSKYPKGSFWVRVPFVWLSIMKWKVKLFLINRQRDSRMSWSVNFLDLSLSWSS